MNARSAGLLAAIVLSTPILYGGCHPNCGNGVLQPDKGEECDDSNHLPQDGCSATCQIEGPSACTYSTSPYIQKNSVGGSNNWIFWEMAAYTSYALGYNGLGYGVHSAVCNEGDASTEWATVLVPSTQATPPPTAPAMLISRLDIAPPFNTVLYREVSPTDHRFEWVTGALRLNPTNNAIDILDVNGVPVSGTQPPGADCTDIRTRELQCLKSNAPAQSSKIIGCFASTAGCLSGLVGGRATGCAGILICPFIFYNTVDQCPMMQGHGCTTNCFAGTCNAEFHGGDTLAWSADCQPVEPSFYTCPDLCMSCEDNQCVAGFRITSMTDNFCLNKPFAPATANWCESEGTAFYSASSPMKLDIRGEDGISQVLSNNPVYSSLTSPLQVTNLCCYGAPGERNWWVYATDARGKKAVPFKWKWNCDLACGQSTPNQCPGY